MKYTLSKKEFLSAQDKLYDEIEDILKKEIIHSIDYKLVKQNLFYVQDEDTTTNKRYTYNINPWLQEIRWLTGNINEELILCLAYNSICDKCDVHLRNSLKFVSRERYLKLVLYDLFTFREKVAFLIYEVFNRQIKIPINEHVCVNNKPEIKKRFKDLERNKVSFHKIREGLRFMDICQENITWINDSELKLIKYIVNQFATNKSVKIFNEVRHPFTHRSNPGIDCLPLYSFEYKQIDKLTQKMCLQMDKRLGIKNPEKLNYIVKSAIPLEKQIKFEEIISDILKVWELFINGLENLLNNVVILNKQISKIDYC
ncbi:hypothetical protein [Clostridium tetani]|uniref:hypothetical protein n=1 Tax=Clostridium tetani TaxID=1513 RepID=UPI00100AFB7D|nr:hypothetical protein [Clostridium tetani]RXM59331.1 hypothetical protein DP133_00135 [Clostridium tetani]